MQLDTRRLEAQPLLAAMFERAPHGIAMTDLSGRYVRANPAFLRLLGYSEREVLQLIAEGRTGAEIAERLTLSQKTVETYRARLIDKLGIRDVPSLVRFAIQRGLVSLD